MANVGQRLIDATATTMKIKRFFDNPAAQPAQRPAKRKDSRAQVNCSAPG